jgi:hypothetical protein
MLRVPTGLKNQLGLAITCTPAYVIAQPKLKN